MPILNHSDHVLCSQCVFEVLVNFHNGCLVAASIAVVWRYGNVSQIRRFIRVGEGLVLLTREDCHHITVLRPVVTFHDELVSTGNQGQPVVVIESL